MDLFQFEALRLLDVSIKILTTFFLTIPIAWEREYRTRIMGLRTFPLVAVASCAFVLVARTVIGEDASVQSRIIQGLMTGIGFIGGGAILKEDDRVRGTATAATVWMTGALGASIAYGELEIAIVLSAVTFATLTILTRVKQNIDAEGESALD